jgi:hypothetical protein
MREYAKVAPRFWTGETGRGIRKAGPDATLVALYLLTCPHANMVGLYYLPLPFIGHETGLSARRVRAAFDSLVRLDFVRHDAEREMVWVREMARFQVAPRLKGTDKRVTGIRALLSRLPATPLLTPFMERYARVFHLTETEPQPSGSNGGGNREHTPNRRSLVARNRDALARQTGHGPDGGAPVDAHDRDLRPPLDLPIR